jgi:hypothetical protein
MDSEIGVQLLLKFPVLTVPKIPYIPAIPSGTHRRGPPNIQRNYFLVITAG